MEVAIIEYFPSIGYEVWITDLIEIGSGLGSVFDTHEEAVKYAQEHKVTVVDISHIEIDTHENIDLLTLLSPYLEISPSGKITGIRQC